ncbi:NAD-dependent deacetylase sirtuin-5 [Lineolata rhizophorae]|uniref:NAD-dependent deacetylase sirtuin-5 n=1 Tax=Lineolata rhizophorae TaxID=578093 RepID=A0A6A6NR10_9PEZI|nr:NAD-dependent deacetylase sirtuin-5 [Lineolata rhizophorae]
MASKAATSSSIPTADLESFSSHLQSSRRILALLGAGLSASSGLPTFRGAGGLWRTHDAVSLATPEAFQADPGLVWQFYNYRRHMALRAQPNNAHYALAQLARKTRDFETLSQNVDGLSQRAGHPGDKLHLLHGSLFDIKCGEFFCDYVQKDNFTNPVVPALAIPTGEIDPTSNAARGARELDISDEKVELPEVAIRDLPHCPKCKTGILRPGVVWFGEALPRDTIRYIDDWIHATNKIDLILVIGTSAKVYPAAGYVDTARARGARVAVVNTERTDAPGSGLTKKDWFFQGDAAEVVPQILKPIIGELETRAQQA